MFAKNYETAFKLLAKLQDIPLKKGWKKAIANFFNIEQSLLSNWFKRGAPDTALDYASEMGFPPKLWYNNLEPYLTAPETLMRTYQHVSSQLRRSTVNKIPALAGNTKYYQKPKKKATPKGGLTT